MPKLVLPSGKRDGLLAIRVILGGFGSNISSLQAQRRLSQVSETLRRSFERLSTGQRINAASDDAAGLAIADRLRVNTRLYTGAQRNISDVLSMLNIADSTVQDQSDILMRLQELADSLLDTGYGVRDQRLQICDGFRVCLL